MRPSKLRLPLEHRDDRQVLGVDDVGDLLRQRAGVADAGRAAVADEVEAELLEVRDQAGALVVLHDDLRARGERRLDPRLDLSGRARRRSWPAGPAPSITDGFDVFVQLVIAAITTCPWSSVGLGAVGERDLRLDRRRGRPPARRRCPTPAPRERAVAGARRGAGGSEAGNDSATASSHASLSGRKPSSAIRNDALDSVSDTRSCGRFGPASDGTTSPRSSSSVSE